MCSACSSFKLDHLVHRHSCPSAELNLMTPHLCLSDSARPFNLIVYNCNFKNKAAAWRKSRTQTPTWTSLYGAAPLFTRELYFRCAHCLRENKANLNSYWPSFGRILCWQSNTGLLTLWFSYFCCGHPYCVHKAGSWQTRQRACLRVFSGTCVDLAA